MSLISGLIKIFLVVFFVTFGVLLGVRYFVWVLTEHYSEELLIISDAVSDSKGLSYRLQSVEGELGILRKGFHDEEEKEFLARNEKSYTYTIPNESEFTLRYDNYREGFKGFENIYTYVLGFCFPDNVDGGSSCPTIGEPDKKAFSRLLGKEVPVEAYDYIEVDQDEEITDFYVVSYEVEEFGAPVYLAQVEVGLRDVSFLVYPKTAGDSSIYILVKNPSTTANPFASATFVLKEIKNDSIFFDFEWLYESKETPNSGVYSISIGDEGKITHFLEYNTDQ